jgi:signal transduction histidine kinase
MDALTKLTGVLEQLGAAPGGTTALLAQLPVGVIIAEAPGGRFLFANDRVAAIWRRPFVACAGEHEYNLYPAVHSDGRTYDSADWPVSRVLRTGAAVEPERIEFVRGDGTHGFMLCSAAPVLNAEGTMAAVVVMLDDVTGSHLAERRLRAVAEIASLLNRARGRDEVAKSVLEVAVPTVGAYGGALVSVSADGDWFELIGASGYSEAQLVAFRRYPVSTPAPTRDALRQNRAIFLSRPDDWDSTYVVRPSQRSASAAAIPLRAQGHVLGVFALSFELPHEFDNPERAFLVTVADLAAQALARAAAFDAAAAANSGKDYFFATVSHELRSPLTSIQGWTQILRKMDVPEPMQRGLASIERNAQVQATLISDLVDFAQASSGKLHLKIEDVDLARSVRDTFDALRPEAAHRDVHVELQIADVPPIRGDANRLQQVATNLVGNALKFTPSGGMIVVRLEKRETEVLLEVSDTGIGIEPDLLPAIFEPFRQGDGRGHRGLGLGLSIVRHIVEALGGRVSARSAGAGQGATFSVSLPLTRAV